jgi:hypothetical protein
MGVTETCSACVPQYIEVRTIEAPTPMDGDAEPPVAGGRVPYDDPRLNLFAIPVALALTVAAKLLVLPGLVLDAVVQPFFHELGHASVAWAGSRFAVPIFLPAFGFTSIPGLAPSWPLFLAIQLGLGWGIRRCLRELRVGAALLLAAASVLNLMATLLVPADTWHMWVLYGGIGGEFWLATLAIALFQVRLPDRLRWDFFRLIALFLGVWSLTTVFWQWRGIAHDIARMPLGSVMVGRGDVNGDLNHLMDRYGWTAGQIIHSYLRLGGLCVVTVGASWLVGVRRARLQDPPVR